MNASGQATPSLRVLSLPSLSPTTCLSTAVARETKNSHLPPGSGPAETDPRRPADRGLAFSLSLGSLVVWMLFVSLPWAGAAPEGTPEEFQVYQESFHDALKLMGDTPETSGPRWIQPEAVPGKEGCTSCHLGVTDQRFLLARQPYRRHSGHLLEDHPPERFGCTVCHGGSGEGLTFTAAGHADPAGPEGMLPAAAIPGRCSLCHSGPEMPDGSEAYVEARRVVEEKRCIACHRFREEPESDVLRAVRLERLGSKVGARWLGAYLGDPSRFRPGTAMPAYSFEKGEAEALTAYLLSLEDPEIPWSAEESPPEPALVEEGRTFVRDRRCTTCHDVPGIAEEGFVKQRKIGPPLDGVGEKLNPGWIRKWLLDPAAVRAGTGMPPFRLETREVEAIAAFLSSLRVGGATPSSPSSTLPPEAKVIREIAAKYRCAACHEIAGLDLSSPERTDLRSIGPELLRRLPGAAEGGLEGPQGVFHRGPDSPRLFAAGEETGPLRAFLAGQIDRPIRDGFRRLASAAASDFDPREAAGGLVEKLRCLSCHTIQGKGGDIGPDLSYGGSKLKKEWIGQFLQTPEAIRPMNRARMPVLGIGPDEAEALADWIASDLKNPDVEQGDVDLESAFSFVGEAKVKSPYGCVACHRIGEEGGEVGPELSHVGSRLRTRWIYHWIRDPMRWVPGVRMPNFKMTEEDLRAITAYLSELQ